MSQSFHLLQIQKIDSQIDRINQRLSEIDTIITNDRRLLEAAERIADLDKENLAQQRVVKRIEQDIESVRIKLQLNQHNLYSGKIRNPKELQDLQKEAESLRKHTTQLEDKLLDEMIIFEETQHKLVSAKEEEQKITGIVVSEQSTFTAKKTQLTEEKERLNIERDAAKSQISNENLALYTTLREKKRGLAVTTIQDSACTACGSELTPAEYQAARSPIQIVYCSSCGRIIYAG